MNTERRKVLAGKYADLAKYTVGAGIIAGFWAGKLTVFLAIMFFIGFIFLEGVFTLIGLVALTGVVTALYFAYQDKKKKKL